MTMRLLEWDAISYDRLPLPHERWGAGVVSRLELTGHETVLDLGCGTGRDAGRLLEVLPHGHVIAVDGSQQMLARLRDRLADVAAGRLDVVQADLREPLPVRRHADAAISVATLQWLDDHATVFGHIAAVLRPGAQFVAEAGGHGNCDAFRRALAEVTGDDGAHLWTFPTVEETVAHLRAAGFEEVEVRLVPDPIRLEEGDQLEAFLATVLLGAQLRDLAPAERLPFVRAVAGRLREPVIDYVRLQLTARKAATGAEQVAG